MGCGSSVDTRSSGGAEPTNTWRERSPPPPPRKTGDIPNSKMTAWEAQALQSHNKFRALHGVPPLTLKKEISQKAQAYAEYLAKNDLFEHSRNRENLGENLYAMSSSAPMTEDVPLGSDASQSWYDEINSYDFGNPDFSMATGHFTQLVWKNSTSLGIGVAFGQGGKRAVVVAQYGPAGNVMGQFAENVPPPL